MTDTSPDKSTPNSAPAGATAPAGDAEKNKVMAVLAYIGILWLVPLLAAKDSPFAMYHANQGLVLFLAWIALSFVSGIIPFLGWLVLGPIVMIAGLILAIMGIMNALNGKMSPLPLIGSFKILK